ncbi:MAG: 23S rRNA (pseudouridine(1915)-N(3))-methyltransferase RlmH [Desulfovibrio sp.]|nr:23S rRNA (pseudouridine(1915)-N(3))-methyltransferase RlmH [Desulfovibrio sp.]
MARRPYQLIVVGKLKHRYTQEGVKLYLERLGNYRKLILTEVRDADPTLPLPKRLEQEATRILKALPKECLPFILDEKGQSLSSVQLAKLLKTYDEQGTGPLAFIIGGPFGLAEEVKAKARQCLSLSALTLPHELARLVLLEQLYRAETIMANSPYHH